MILTRLRDAIREQNWFAVLLEVLIVVVGVVIGFQVTAWGQTRSDAAHEQDYLRQLAADLHETESRVLAVDAQNRPGGEALVKFIRAFSSDPRPPADSLFIWGWETRTIEPVTPVLGTTQALVSTGDIRLIRNDSLRSAIVAYLDQMHLVISIGESITFSFIRRYEDFQKQFDVGRAAQIALSSEELDSLTLSDYLFADAPNSGSRPYPDPAGMLDNLELHAALRNLRDTRSDYRYTYDLYLTSSRELATLVAEELGPVTASNEARCKTSLNGVNHVTGCTTSDNLPDGRWTGSLTPMNHLDSPTSIQFDVSSIDDQLKIMLIGPDGDAFPLVDPVLNGQTLRYSFREPEQGVLLECELEQLDNDFFEGKCSAPDGKWALFKMIPPSE